ncbi:MAG: hypothetical protein A2Z29_08825 [Chloroflexi bacterium RBG_16_56_11]|nr:MAG: hypothetical protein A2Z29_08825 [Chloroflexi bacterium RBG_16_56_11]
MRTMPDLTPRFFVAPLLRMTFDTTLADYGKGAFFQRNAQVTDCFVAALLAMTGWFCVPPPL